MKKTVLLVSLTTAALCCFSQKNSKRYSSADTAYPAIFIAKQSRFVINLHSGYSVGLGSTFKFYPDDVRAISVMQNGTNEPVKNSTYANPSKGLGDGFKFGFGGSYIVNDFINVGIDFDYFNSTIKKYRDSSIHQTNLLVSGPTDADEHSYFERNTISYNATLLSVTPHITFKAISRPKWFLYNKLGAIITFRPNSLQKDITDVNTSMGWQGFYRDSSSSTVKKYEWGIKNPAFGFMGAFGGQIKLADRFRIFAEVQFSHIVFVIRKRTLTDFIVNQQHLENNFPVSMRELEFVKSFSTSTNAGDPGMPSQTLVQRIPITYVGLQAGISYLLK
jgi:hypothetical protein